MLEINTTEIPETGSGNETATLEPYRHPFDSTATIASAAVLLPPATFGIFANLLTVYVILKTPKLRTIFNFFIVSLCISDFISAILTPLFLYRRTWGFDHWAISGFLCKFFWAGDTGTSISTSFHILCFSFLRLFSIMWPHHYKVIKPFHAKVCIFVIWIVAIGTGFVPFLIWFDAQEIDRSVDGMERAWPACTILIDWLPQFRMYIYAGYPIFYYIPLGLIVVCSLGVTVVILMRRNERVKGKSNDKQSTETQRQRKENQAVLQLALIVGSYMFGYIPLTAYHIYATNVKAVTYEDHVFNWWFGMAEYMCLRLSESLNPVFYNMASSTMRNETFSVLRKICGISPKAKYKDNSSNNMQVSAITTSAGVKSSKT